MLFLFVWSTGCFGFDSIDRIKINPPLTKGHYLFLFHNKMKKRENKQQVFVRTLTGETILLNIPGGPISLTDIQQQIERRTQIPVAHQRLIYAGRPLSEGGQNNLLEPGSTLHLTLRLKGGFFVADFLTPIIVAIVAAIIITVAITWRNFLSGIFCALTKGSNMFKCLVFYFLFCAFNIAYYLFVKIPLFLMDAIFGTDFFGMWGEVEAFAMELMDAFGEFAPNAKNALDENVFSCFRC